MPYLLPTFHLPVTGIERSFHISSDFDDGYSYNLMKCRQLTIKINVFALFHNKIKTRIYIRIFETAFIWMLFTRGVNLVNMSI